MAPRDLDQKLDKKKATVTTVAIKKMGSTTRFKKLFEFFHLFTGSIRSDIIQHAVST